MTDLLIFKKEQNQNNSPVKWLMFHLKATNTVCPANGPARVLVTETKQCYFSIECKQNHSSQVVSKMEKVFMDRNCIVKRRPHWQNMSSYETKPSYLMFLRRHLSENVYLVLIVAIWKKFELYKCIRYISLSFFLCYTNFLGAFECSKPKSKFTLFIESVKLFVRIESGPIAFLLVVLAGIGSLYLLLIPCLVSIIFSCTYTTDLMHCLNTADYYMHLSSGEICQSRSTKDERCEKTQEKICHKGQWQYLATSKGKE